MNAPTAGSIAAQLLVEHLARTIAEHIQADLEHTYGWACRVAVPAGWVTDPMLAVHHRANFIADLLRLQRATHPNLEDGQ